MVDASDVVIQVLDARDPLACRAPEVERFVRSRGAGKRIVLLLNKVDLVPRHAAEAWLAYFRDELPTVAFKCATSGAKAAPGRRAVPRSAARGAGGAAGAAAAQTAAAAAAAASAAAAATGAGNVSGADCAGAELLVGLLKNYARSGGRKTGITVGIVGLPNVGKSSLINSLCRSRAAATGATPGLTRSAQEVALDKHVKLLDSPGIVFATTTDASSSSAALRNAIRVEKLDDPLPPVEEILRRAPAATLCALYAIPSYAEGDAAAFLRCVAARQGKLRKGGVPDVEAAARVVLSDWNAGKIPFFTMPPARPNSEHNAAVVVGSFGPDFDVSALNDAVCGAEAGAGVPHEDEAARMPSEGALPGFAELGEAEAAATAAEAAAASAVAAAAAARAAVAAAAPAAMDADVPAKRGKKEAKPQGAVLYSPDMKKPGAAKTERRKAKKAAAATAAQMDEGGGGGGGGGGDGDEFDWARTAAVTRQEAARVAAAVLWADGGGDDAAADDGDEME